MRVAGTQEARNQRQVPGCPTLAVMPAGRACPGRWCVSDSTREAGGEQDAPQAYSVTGFQGVPHDSVLLVELCVLLAKM